jgi:hypothetical protein
LHTCPGPMCCVGQTCCLGVLAGRADVPMMGVPGMLGVLAGRRALPCPAVPCRALPCHAGVSSPPGDWRIWAKPPQNCSGCSYRPQKPPACRDFGYSRSRDSWHVRAGYPAVRPSGHPAPRPGPTSAGVQSRRSDDTFSPVDYPSESGAFDSFTDF